MSLSAVFSIESSANEFLPSMGVVTLTTTEWVTPIYTRPKSRYKIHNSIPSFTPTARASSPLKPGYQYVPETRHAFPPTREPKRGIRESDSLSI
jgi:hypothetical protein